MDYKAVNRKKLRGFTLIEMIVVIAIIGILASMLSIAMSIYVRESRIQAQNSNARVVYSTVTDWLVDMEVKNVDLHRFCVGDSEGDASISPSHYFEICSRSLIEDSTGFNRADPNELYVSLNATGPFDNDPEFFTRGALISGMNTMMTEHGTTVGQNAAIYQEWLDKLGDSFAPGSEEFVWRAIVNADNYSVLITYAEDLTIAESEKPPTTKPTGLRIYNNAAWGGAHNHLFPNQAAGGGYGFGITEQENYTIADPRNMFGQYPYGPITDETL
ncbi:MAG: type II secretion system GspH family protein [Ruminococcus sp.]|jgi:prepilin-type N-terminal cleavage/methylation domain-containing protein|nr:type II secretion system GspH family protein [Ruminococcus sp.]